MYYCMSVIWNGATILQLPKIVEVYFYHKAFERYMLDVIWKSGNQKAEMTVDEPKTISWLNLQTERFGFKKSLGVMCWQGISSIWLCQHIKYSIVFAFLVVKMKANEKPRHESFTIIKFSSLYDISKIHLQKLWPK